MRIRTCQSCAFAMTINGNLRCGRVQTMADGSRGRASTPADIVTDSIPEPQRVPRDKCGPERTHWEKRT